MIDIGEPLYIDSGMSYLRLPNYFSDTPKGILSQYTPDYNCYIKRKFRVVEVEDRRAEIYFEVKEYYPNSQCG